MAVNYPLNLPLKPAPKSFTVNALSGNAVTRSPFSGAMQIQTLQLQSWSFSIALPPMSEDQARDWFAMMMALNGQYGTLYAGDPKWKSPRGTWAGSPVVDTAGQAGLHLMMRGFSAAASVRGGDMFQHGTGSSSRLYMVTQDAVADGSGNLTLDIWPQLRISPADGDTVVTSSPKGVFRLASSLVSRSWEPFRHGFSFDLMEAL